ncbi:MAG: mucoidy inhibitor MuiA family protein [Chitinophagaceae bacterium]
MLMRILLSATLLCLFIDAHSQVKKIPAETTIENVTIFSSGARVERTSTIGISPGRSEISFAGLSNQLDQQSVQLQADANITLLSVQATKDFLSERKIDQEEKNFIEHTTSLKDKLDLDMKLLEVYKNEEAMLVKNQAIGGQSGVKTTELKDALDLQRQRLTEVYQKQLEIQKRIAEEQADSERSKSQLQEISKKRDSINYVVTALVESKETRNIKFQLLYNIKDAGWYPAYDVRIKNITDPLSVLMNANVFQRSGETWKNISLLLSTGNPNDNATPSQLQPWMPGFYDPSVSFRSQGVIQGAATGRITDEKDEPIANVSVNVKGTSNGTITDANGFFKIQNFASNSSIIVSGVGFESKQVAIKPGYFTIILKQSSQALTEVVVTGYGALQGTAAGVEISDNKFLKDKKQSIQTVTVATQYQPTTTVYKIDDKYTLETDGKTTKIGIREFDVPAVYDYFSAPKIDPSGFLTAKIINWQDYDLQSGEASLYFEGTYLGKTYIDLGSVGDTLPLSLGKDNGVKVSRKLVKEFSSKRFIGSNRTETRQYEISVRNTKREAVNITVTDQFPVSTSKEIDVNDQKAPGAEADKETGITVWTMTLQPGQEKKLNISYSVKYPKDRRVVLE